MSSTTATGAAQKPPPRNAPPVPVGAATAAATTLGGTAAGDQSHTLTTTILLEEGWSSHLPIPLVISILAFARGVLKEELDFIRGVLQPTVEMTDKARASYWAAKGLSSSSPIKPGDLDTFHD